MIQFDSLDILDPERNCLGRIGARKSDLSDNVLHTELHDFGQLRVLSTPTNGSTCMVHNAMYALSHLANGA
jgi:hypothetical protein